MIGHTALAHERQQAHLAEAEDLRRARQARYQQRLLASATPASGSVLHRVAAWLLHSGSGLRPVPPEGPASDSSGRRRVTG